MSSNPLPLLGAFTLPPPDAEYAEAPDKTNILSNSKIRR